MNDLAIPFAEQTLDTLESHHVYIEWGLPNYVGHKWVYWDPEAGMVLEEDEEANRMVRVPQERWKAGRVIQSKSEVPAKTEEERFPDLRSALDWLMSPLPKGAR
jgi:hypothetical protein